MKNLIFCLNCFYHGSHGILDDDPQLDNVASGLISYNKKECFHKKFRKVYIKRNNERQTYYVKGGDAKEINKDNNCEFFLDYQEYEKYKRKNRSFQEKFDDFFFPPTSMW